MQDLKIIEKKENPLFNRKEIIFQIDSEITPSRVEVGNLIVKEFSTSLDKIKIKSILGKFGSKNFKVNVFIYDSEENKNSVEPKRKKDGLLSEKPKPVEEKQEEVKEEPKEEIKKPVESSNSDKDYKKEEVKE